MISVPTGWRDKVKGTVSKCRDSTAVSHCRPDLSFFLLGKKLNGESDGEKRSRSGAGSRRIRYSARPDKCMARKAGAVKMLLLATRMETPVHRTSGWAQLCKEEL